MASPVASSGAGDQVAGACDRAADHRAVRLVDVDARATVWHCGRAGGVGADVVALHDGVEAAHAERPAITMLPDTTLRASGLVPPIVAPAAKLRMPDPLSAPLPIDWLPVTSVPMKLPCTVELVAGWSMMMPPPFAGDQVTVSCAGAAWSRVLRAADVYVVAVEDPNAVALVGHGRHAGGVRADEAAGDRHSSAR